MLWLSNLGSGGALGGSDMNQRRSATLTAILCGTGLVAWLAGFGSASIENTAATLDRLAPLLAADLELADLPQPTAMRNPGIGNLDVAKIGRAHV